MAITSYENIGPLLKTALLTTRAEGFPRILLKNASLVGIPNLLGGAPVCRLTP
jgi:hypothetical protein